jgi:hypothetical protein
LSSTPRTGAVSLLAQWKEIVRSDNVSRA